MKAGDYHDIAMVILKRAVRCCRRQKPGVSDITDVGRVKIPGHPGRGMSDICCTRYTKTTGFQYVSPLNEKPFSFQLTAGEFQAFNLLLGY